jgi:DNA-binding NarL/FixJ family response regulator
MMKSKTIVLWGREDLLSSSVELFLTAQKGWKVINISNEENFDALLLAVDKEHPDVVILQQGDRAGNSNLPIKLLQDHPGLKVITVSLNDNLMEVYSKQNILVKSASDLISVVEAVPVNVNQQ